MTKENKKSESRFMRPEEIAQMEAVFNERFFNDLKKDENIFFEGHYEDDVCYLELILKNHDESFYYPVETTISLKDHPILAPDDARLVLLDFIGAYFEDYFGTDRESLIPIDWAPFKMGDLTIYARGQVLNKKLEKMAEDILKGEKI
ncbi:MAG: hypothetical protein WCQ53_02825 [bacterium]